MHTPLLNVRDLGTEFVVEAAPTECSVHVIKGLVEVNPLTQSNTSLSEGSAIVAGPNHRLAQMPASRELYVSAAKMAEKAWNYETRHNDAWNAAREKHIQDPDLLFHFDMSGKKNGMNAFYSPTGNADVQRIGCREVPGAFHGLDALAFVSDGDRIRFSIPEKRDSFTLCASVCLNDLFRAGNPILSVGDVGPKALHWQINYLGEVQLLIGPSRETGLVKYSSSAVLNRNDAGGWIHLAVTVDAKRMLVTHYLDGKAVAALPLQDREHIDFSDAEIGNWRHQTRRDNNQTPLNGRIGEFSLYGRVMTEEEIRDMAATIRPEMQGE